MLYWLGDLLEDYYGPFRLLQSRMVLAAIGLGCGATAVWLLLPRLQGLLPRDRGRDHAVNAEDSIGKPTGAGVLFIPILVLVAACVVPWYDASSPSPHSWHAAPMWVLLCLLVALVTGFADDRSTRPWGELSKGLTDLGIALVTALALCQLRPVTLWLPFIPGELSTFEVSPAVYLTVATVILWISINTTNCTDGVDGLSGSLLIFAFLYLGGVLYVVVGHAEVAAYLRVPHTALGADWAVLAFSVMGVLIGYLWYNADPSAVLMGDAGSRPLGLLLGVLALATGNPLFLFVVAGVVLVNGGTGLVKVALLRFFRIGILRGIRFPLHDHCRKNLGWSNTQVMVRFMIVQAVLAPIAIVFFIKIR